MHASEHVLFSLNAYSTHALNSGARCLKYSFAFSLPGRLDPVTLPGLGPPRRASFFSLARSMK